MEDSDKLKEMEIIIKKVKEDVGLTDEQAEKAVGAFFEAVSILSANNNFEDLEVVIDPDDEVAIRKLSEDVEDD